MARKADLNAWPIEVRNNILIRELMRQALFMAERDDRGLPTRDVTLGESPQEAREGVRGLMAHAFLRDLDGVQVQLFRDAAMAADGEPVPEVHPVPDGEPADPVPGAHPERGSGQDRSRGAGGTGGAVFARGVRGARQRAGRAAAGGGGGRPVGIGTEVERRLGEMNFISQYAAVRAGTMPCAAVDRHPRRWGRWCAGMRTSGSSRASIGRRRRRRSMRAACCTPSGWCARRGMGAKPALGRALRHRAYAAAVAGLQGPAWRTWSGRTRLIRWRMPAQPGGWRCSARIAGSNRASCGGGGARRRMRRWRCSWLPDGRAGRPERDPGYGQVALSASPDCLRVVDAMSAVSGVSANHVLTEAAPTVLAGSIVGRLVAIPDLPASVRCSGCGG